MRKIPLAVPFLLALCATLFGSIVPIPISPWAPFLAITYHKSTLSRSLWIALLCGTLHDLLSSELRLGLYALNFVVITLLLYRQKNHFFEDKPIGLSLFTLLIAATSTLLQIVLTHLFDRGIPLSWRVIGIDVVVLSLIDAVYAFLWFTSPLRLYTYISKTNWRRYFRAQTDEQ